MTLHPMVEQVDRIVGNTLAGGGELFLPGIGSLYIQRRGAKRISRHSVVPPCRMVAFASQQRGASLVDEIARVLTAGGAGVAGAARLEESQSEEQIRAQAQDIYERWQRRTLRDGVLTLSGIGVLKFKHFTPDEAFDRRINPQGHEPVRIRFGRRFDWALFIGGSALLVAALFGGVGFLMLYSDGMSPERMIAEQSVAEKSVEGEGVWSDRTSAGTPIDSADNERETTERPSPDEGSEPVGSESVPRASSESAAPAGMSGVRSDASSAGVSEPVASVSPATPSQVSPATPSQVSPAGEEPSPASLVSGCRYAVLGVYSTAENAGRAVRAAAKKDPSLKYGIYRFGAKFLVSPFVSEDADACTRFIGEQSGQFPGMWTYTAR